MRRRGRQAQDRATLEKITAGNLTFPQRFSLSDDPAPAAARERLAIVSRAYGPPVPDLAGMMRQAAWFCIAAILDMRLSQGLATPGGEYDKFVRLERQTHTFERLL